MTSPMTRVSSLVSKDIGNYLTNKQTWGGILYNVKAYGAKGDGVADDTAAIQKAIDDAANNGGGTIFFPSGSFRITSPLSVLASSANNITISGTGSGTVILLDLSSGEYAFTQGTDNVGGIVIRDMDFRPYGTTYDFGAINITKTTRGISFYNLRTFSLKYGYKIDGDIFAIVSFFGCKAYLPLEYTGSYGFYFNGNTIHCYGCESVGFETCVYWQGRVGSWDGGSIAGSDGFAARYCLYVEEAYQLKLSNVWMEEPTVDDEPVKILSGSVTFDNVNISSGSMIIDGGLVKIENTFFGESDGRINAGADAIVVVGDNVIKFGGGRPVYSGSGDNALGKTIMKPSFDDIFDSAPNGLLDNPTLITRRANPLVLINGLASMASETTDYITGDRSIKVTTTSGSTGVKLTVVGVVPGRLYTMVARVKIVSGATKILSSSFPGSDTTSSPDVPGREVRSTGWNILKIGLSSTTDTIDARIIADIAGVFLIDSVNLLDGVMEKSPERSFVTSDNLYLRGRRIEYNSAAPTSGDWITGDIIMNTAPTASGKIGWVCVTAGSPGTWKTWGAIDA